MTSPKGKFHLLSSYFWWINPRRSEFCAVCSVQIQLFVLTFIVGTTKYIDLAIVIDGAMVANGVRQDRTESWSGVARMEEFSGVKSD